MKQLFIQLNVAIALLLAFSLHCFGADTYTLKYNLETGKTYKQNVVTVTDMKMNVMGQEMNMNATMEMNVSYEVTGQKNDVFDLKTTYQKIKTSMTSPAPFVIDSDSPENSSDKSLGDVFKSLTEVPIDIQLSQTGKVLSVTGIDKLSEKLNAISNPQFKQMFSQQFSEKAIKTTFEQMSSYFPDKPVTIGDNWDVTINLNTNGLDLISKMNLTLKEIKDNIATLDCTGTLATPEGGSVLQIQGMDATVTVKGNQTGTIRLDIKTGWIVGMELTQTSTQNIEVMGQAMQQQMETKITVV